MLLNLWNSRAESRRLSGSEFAMKRMFGYLVYNEVQCVSQSVAGENCANGLIGWRGVDGGGELPGVRTLADFRRLAFCCVLRMIPLSIVITMDQSRLEQRVWTWCVHQVLYTANSLSMASLENTFHSKLSSKFARVLGVGTAANQDQ